MKTRPHSKLLKSVPAALLGIAGFVCNVSAVSLAPGGAVATPGTDIFARPELIGVVVANSVTPFQGTDVNGNVLFTGILEAQVIRETGTDTLDFYYQITNNAGSTDAIIRFSNLDFSGFNTDVDFRIDLSGTVGSASATRQLTGNTVSFDFPTLGAGAQLGLAPGQTSKFLFIKTNAKTFVTGSTVVINGGRAAVPTYAPVPEPGASALLFVGIGAILLLTVQRTRRA